MSGQIILTVGFLAQSLFAVRMLVQWLTSEKLGRVASPLLFWQISLIACVLMMGYGVLRQDMAILTGQVITYFIYLRNLYYQQAWNTFPKTIQIFLIVLPVIVLSFLLKWESYTLSALLINPEIGSPLLIWGITGQIIFAGRFIYQWYLSEMRKISLLPLGFWILSIFGACSILLYAVLRKDPVLFIGQLAGLVIYLRNLYLSICPSVSK